jgi:hypothetical protein
VDADRQVACRFSIRHVGKQHAEFITATTP